MIDEVNHGAMDCRSQKVHAYIHACFAVAYSNVSPREICKYNARAIAREEFLFFLNSAREG